MPTVHFSPKAGLPATDVPPLRGLISLCSRAINISPHGVKGLLTEVQAKTKLLLLTIQPKHFFGGGVGWPDLQTQK